MRRNIELKAKCDDLDGAIRAAEKLGAALSGELAQSDTYYHVLAGRLKIRREGNHRELIAYSRPDLTGARKSEFHLIPLAEDDALHDALTSTLGIMGEVHKTRLLYMHRNVRIHLDRVRGLGSFIEFEAIVDDRCDENAAAEKVEKLIGVFNIRKDDIVGGSYSDLLGFAKQSP